LIGTLKERINAEFNHEICIMVSILDVNAVYSPTPKVRTSYSDRIVAKELFKGFLTVFFDKFIDICEEYKEYHRIDNYIAVKVDDLLQTLLFEIEVGSAHPQTREGSRSLTTKGKRGKRAGGGIGASITNLHPSTKIEVSLGKSVETTVEEAESVNIETLLQTDLYKVRKSVLGILEYLDINVFHILIDEWMELDKNTPSKVQSHFAQLLKKTFFNEKGFQ
jgi:hypothetical protein